MQTLFKPREKIRGKDFEFVDLNIFSLFRIILTKFVTCFDRSQEQQEQQQQEQQQGSISPMFYEKLLRAQIPKSQKGCLT